MIDEKKIEEAAAYYAEENAIQVEDQWGDMITDTEELSEAYKEGANLAINEFLKDLWHPFDEVPTRKDSNILQFFESYSTGTEDDFDEYFELAHTREGFTQETWEEFMNEGGVPSKWLYIDDLFPKKGGKQ